tara:strand:+ start:258 stop:545 length:288 start_codon:yes stop_codon:yes gene_type:complete
MPAGLQVFNSSQVPILDTSNYVGKFGTVATVTQGTNGNVSVSLAAGQSLTAAIDDNGDISNPVPSVNVSGGTVSWTWPPGTTVSSRAMKIQGMIF